MRRQESAGVFGGMPRSPGYEHEGEEARKRYTVSGLKSQTEIFRLYAKGIGKRSFK